MRLRTLNRLSQVSSAVVTALLVGAGCHVHQTAKPLQSQTMPARLIPQSITEPATTEAATEPATLPAATEPATLPTTEATAIPATVPVTQPVSPAPAAAPAEIPATLPATLPATEASAEPASAPATEPVAPPTADAALPTDPDQIEADHALAEQLDSVAELQFANKLSRPEVWPVLLKHEAALLSACATLDSTGGRFARLLADAMAQMHDTDGEAAALVQAINADPDDEFSWNRRLELHLAPMQSAREKIDYLRDIIGRNTSQMVNGVKAPPVPPDVRAHAAYLCAQLMLERGENDAAKAVLAEALRSCPSSVECLTLRYQMLPNDTTRFERCQQLLDLLHANPLQMRYSMELADLIADSGLVQESLPFYQLAVSTGHLQGDPARHSMLNWAAELYIGDEKMDAIRYNSALLQIDPTYTPAYFLQLVLVRSSGDKDALTKTLQQATNALSNRVVDAVNAAAPPDAPKATTRPISDETPLQLPDLAPTVAAIKLGDQGAAGGVSPQVKQQFIEAVADLALLEGYFAEDPAASGKLIDTLSSVLPDNAPELARLRGWNDLLARKSDDAKAKFSTVAAQDPLAELGLIRVMLDNPADRNTAESMGRRLLQDHPSGLLGALLFEQLHSERVKLITTTQADALREAVTQFPAKLLSVVDTPRDFYALEVKAEPVGSFLGDPLLARVIIQNMSEYDLTIGPDGVLKPELLFTLHPKVGDNSNNFNAFDTIAGPTILGSHNRIDQFVRLDQTQFLTFLNTQAVQQFEIGGSLTSNQTARGLGGYPVQFAKSFLRLQSSLTPAHEKAALTAITAGRPDQKITALNLLEDFIVELEQTKDPGMDVRQHVAELIEAVHKARLDPLLAVSAWANRCEFDISSAEGRTTIVRDLADDPDWRHRQIALLLVGHQDAATRDLIVSQLAVDPQSSVRAEALAIKALLALPPAATEPTTEPATAPAPDTAAPTMSP